MTRTKSRDLVDEIVAQWERERPDVDVSAMEIIGRISRLERLISPRLARVFAGHRLEPWEFDVLAALRRSGRPYRLSAGELLGPTMVTSGTMTNRLDRLEARGLITRRTDPSDGRVVLAELTRRGRTTVDDALVDHAENERSIVGVLSQNDRRRLADLLRRLAAELEVDSEAGRR